MDESHVKTIVITGAAGYVGAMLAHQFSLRPDIKKIIGIDKNPLPEFLKPLVNSGVLVWIQENLSEGNWESLIEPEVPEIIIHTAWQIREMYGKSAIQWKWNIEGSDRVFNYAFTHPSVKRLIHFSTVASYAAYPDNEINHFFTEQEPFRVSDYLYAEEKRIAEEHLKALVEKNKQDNKTVPQVFIVRPAAITGPRGRYMTVRVGLQSALSGQLNKGFAQKLMSLLTSWVPLTKKWCRQFIHEDDVTDIVALLAFEDGLVGDYEAFNICPPGPVVTGPDMARAVRKKSVYLPPRLIQIIYFLLWHGSRGKIPTSRGGWKTYSYPISVDGSKITQLFGYQYHYEAYPAFTEFVGRYTSLVPKDRIPNKK
ncbi:MAG: NAD-dependent epimerase/dehydratase family protein [bacterium]